MKNTLFYLIIAAIVIYVIYRMRKPAAKPTATTTTETPSNSGLFVSPSGGGSDTGTVDPGEPQANDEIIANDSKFVKPQTGR